MLEHRMTLRQWVEKFKAGKFAAPDRNTQIKAGWYDWFCRDTSLANKTKKLGPKVVQIAKSPLLDPDKVYVWFKNNCPPCRGLYDDFRISDIETGAVIWTITPKSPYIEMLAGVIPDGETEAQVFDAEAARTVVSGTWNDVLVYFKVKEA